jgi:small subunit ribosomal protein S21
MRALFECRLEHIGRYDRVKVECACGRAVLLSLDAFIGGCAGHCLSYPRAHRPPATHREENCPMEVMVRDNNVDRALRVLKKLMQREGIFREMRLRRAYEKPSERRARERAEAIRRQRKALRKRLEREGY